MTEKLSELHFDAGERVVPPDKPCRLPRAEDWGGNAPSIGGVYDFIPRPGVPITEWIKMLDEYEEEYENGNRPHI